MTADEPVEGRCMCGHEANQHPRRMIARSLGPRSACAHWRQCGCRDGYDPSSSVPVESREQPREWPDPPYYATDMARLLRDAADVPAFRAQGGDDYCRGLQRAAELVEEFGVQTVLSHDKAARQDRRTACTSDECRACGAPSGVSCDDAPEYELAHLRAELADHEKRWQQRADLITRTSELRRRAAALEAVAEAMPARYLEALEAVTAERDRARDLAAHLEEDSERLREQLEAVRALCRDANGYTTHDQIDKLGEPPWRGMDANLIAWEQAHGHDVRLGCDRTECLLLIDPEDIRDILLASSRETQDTSEEGS